MLEIVMPTTMYGTFTCQLFRENELNSDLSTYIVSELRHEASGNTNGYNRRRNICDHVDTTMRGRHALYSLKVERKIER
jgi:hypothetical protein